ncbi:uncharacterized protein LOC135693818 [Rhopilema esculentum]|uniref:uncharacterized protein LOC135693818 n=1 Tax=Rhopilema esculentum TaxID=499914 RepID=UPI0031E470BB|eukprot:gene2756-976_t
MPMKLRDGKLYESLPTSRMLLRDGKVVEVDQSILVAKNGIIFDILDPDTTGHRDRGSSPRKNPPGDTEAGNTILTGRERDRPNLAMDAPRQRRTRRSERLKEEITSEVINKTTEASLITSNFGLMRNESHMQQQEMAVLRSNARKSKNEKFDGGVTKTRFYETKNEFITSTPVNRDSFVNRNVNSDASFVISGKTMTHHETNSHDEIVVRESSFTRIQTNASCRNEFETTTDHKYMQRSPEKRCNESFEDNVFQDLSKPIMYSSLISEDISEVRDQTDFSNMREKSFAGKNLNYDSGVQLNHARWSQFHDWRRQWYLNRWSLYGKHQSNQWFYRLISTIFHMLQLLKETIVSRVLIIFSAFANIWPPKRERRTRASVDMYSQEKSLTVQIKERCCYFIWKPTILLVLLVFLLFWPISDLHFYGTSNFSLAEYNMKNARAILFDEKKGKNPAWLVSPERPRDLSVFGNSFPAIFYIRNPNHHSSKRKLDIFKALSLAAYNVIIPVSTAPKNKLLEGWRWTSDNFNNSLRFLWGEVGVSNNMQELAKDLCAEGYPPSGVIIESDEIIDHTLQVTQFEVWTCNCTTVHNPDGSPFSYTHVRCPVSSENIQADVINCLQALRK